MTEYRSVLERAGSNAPQPDLQVERVLRRRDRRQRNQRISAGALGVIVALALGTIFVRSLTSEPIPADPPVVPRPPPAASGTLTYVLDGDIFVADPDGSNAVRIANGLPDNECERGSVGEDYWAEGTMWSPDGRYVAYRHTECSDPEFRGGVEISDAEGNVITTFPTGAGWDIGVVPGFHTRRGVGSLHGDDRYLRARRRSPDPTHDAARMDLPRRSRPCVDAGRHLGVDRRMGVAARRQHAATAPAGARPLSHLLA